MINQINYYKETEELNNKILKLWNSKVKIFVERKFYQWAINAITVVHKSYSHSATLIFLKKSN